MVAEVLDFVVQKGLRDLTPVLVAHDCFSLVPLGEKSGTKGTSGSPSREHCLQRNQKCAIEEAEVE